MSQKNARPVVPLIKSAPAFNKQVSGRTVTGIFAVHGNVDAGGDRSHPGAFKKTIKERREQLLFLWNHDSWSPATAVIDDIREVGVDELPEKVLKLAPDATGGVEVTRTYLTNPRAEEIFEGISKGAIREMSYAFDLVKWDVEEIEPEDEKYAPRTIRNIREVRLYEVSDVIYGMNPATAAAKDGNGTFTMPLDFLADRVIEGLNNLKAGARNASADLQRINTIGTLAVELGATSITLATEEEEAGDPLEGLDDSPLPEAEAEGAEADGEGKRLKANTEPDREPEEATPEAEDTTTTEEPPEAAASLDERELALTLLALTEADLTLFNEAP